MVWTVKPSTIFLVKRQKSNQACTQLGRRVLKDNELFLKSGLCSVARCHSLVLLRCSQFCRFLRLLVLIMAPFPEPDTGEVLLFRACLVLNLVALVFIRNVILVRSTFLTCEGSPGARMLLLL